mgnify:CR=1 FL=1
MWGRFISQKIGRLEISKRTRRTRRRRNEVDRNTVIEVRIVYTYSRVVTLILIIRICHSFRILLSCQLNHRSLGFFLELFQFSLHVSFQIRVCFAWHDVHHGVFVLASCYFGVDLRDFNFGSHSCFDLERDGELEVRSVRCLFAGVYGLVLGMKSEKHSIPGPLVTLHPWAGSFGTSVPCPASRRPREALAGVFCAPPRSRPS